MSYNNRNNKFERNNRNNGRFERSGNRRNNRFGRRNNSNRDQRIKPKIEEQIAPIEYIPRKNDNTSEKEKDCGTATFIIDLGNNRTAKRKIPIFKSGSDERFLETMEAIRNILIDYNQLTDPVNIAETIAQVKECFAGPARADFSRIVTQVNTDEDTFADEMWEFTAEILPDNAVEEQATYLRSTKKPIKLSAKD